MHDLPPARLRVTGGRRGAAVLHQLEQGLAHRIAMSYFLPRQTVARTFDGFDATTLAPREVAVLLVLRMMLLRLLALGEVLLVGLAVVVLTLMTRFA